MDGWDLVRQAIEVALRFWDRVKQATAIWLRFLNGVKRTWFSILASLFMAVVIIAACYWAWSAWHSWRLAELASVPTTWPNRKMLNDVTVEIQTKCSHSVLSYVVVIIPPLRNAAFTLAEKTDAAKVMTDRLRERLKAIHVQLVDKDGFLIVSFPVGVDQFVRMYSRSDERPVSLEARGTLACNPASYVRAEAPILSWTERHE